MLIIGLFLLAALGGITPWLLRQRLASKPWLEQGLMEEFPAAGALRVPARTLGVGVLLAVIGCLFALLFSAYVMRSELTDWPVARPLPGLLWLNTAILAWSSLALQTASQAAGRERGSMVLGLLAAAGLSAAVFLGAQFALLARLSGEGLFLASNPASSFLWLITIVHGLHLFGGLIALTAIGVLTRRAMAASRAAIGLCAAYWHGMLVIWLFFVALLAGAATGLADFCRQLVS
ncbi:MAG: cytochrome-c oxidase [Hyphomicrobiales bacterium]|nr:cytochrome-c oxidase [Hyphomicrobiales bacterium]